jgi:hypothetical protein
MPKEGKGWNKFVPSQGIASQRSFTLKWLPGKSIEPMGPNSQKIKQLYKPDLASKENFCIV